MEERNIKQTERHEDAKKMKTIFAIELTSRVEDTANDKEGEASVGYAYKVDTSFPELAFAIAGFLKAVDKDEDVAGQVSDDRPMGEAFIAILKAYYDNKEE
jgi:hypothetical protein